MPDWIERKAVAGIVEKYVRRLLAWGYALNTDNGMLLRRVIREALHDTPTATRDCVACKKANGGVCPEDDRYWKWT